jgi:uncharacterized membrane protein
VPDTGYLLYMTPGKSAWSDAALTAGKSFTDPQSGVKITTLSAGATGARVSVTYPPATCARAAPAMSLQPGGTVWTPAGVAVSYTVQAQNRDGCGCAPTSYDVGAAVPAGWGATVTRTPTVAPGATASASILVTPAQAAASAFYPVSITARSVSAPTLVASAPSTVAVQAATSPPPTTTVAALSAKVATSASVSVPRWGTKGVPIVTTVTRNGGPVANATVTVEVRNANGWTNRLYATTGANGTATVTYSLPSDAKKGTFAVTSKATSAGVTTQATTSFVVY